MTHLSMILVLLLGSVFFFSTIDDQRGDLSFFFTFSFQGAC
jgi:hypothetical protein